MLRVLLLCFLLVKAALLAKDYDCAFVGTSPASLLEALYQSASGKKVLILEGASQCGGAWRTIDICGISHVDLGCHHIGGDQKLADFLTDYVGCRIVSMADPSQPFQPGRAPMGLYFSEGCYELIRNLEALVKTATAIDLKLNCRLQNVFFSDGWAILESSSGDPHRAKKIYYTQASDFSVEDKPSPSHRHKYYHLYLLIADLDPARFSYRGGFPKVSRIMNLTYFSGLAASGLQLIVLQVHGEKQLSHGERLFEEMQHQGMVPMTARLIDCEPYVYEQGHCGGIINQLPKDIKEYFQYIETSHFTSITQSIQKWKTVLPLWH